MTGELVVRPGGEVAAPVHTERDGHLSDRARQRVTDGVAENTRTAYSRQWATFEGWCLVDGRVAMPATGETLATYVTELADGDASPATIEQAIAAVRTMHRNAGHPDRPDTRASRLALRDHKRQRADAGRRAKKATPITIPTLRAMVETCDTTTIKGLRDRLVLVLGLALYGRRSELVRLHISDITETENGLLVLIRSSKTDQDAEGAEVAILYGQHAETCPVRVWRAWVAELAAHGITDGRLLRSVTRHNTFRNPSLVPYAIDLIVKDRARLAGLDNWKSYSAHSLRAGGATASASAGAPMTVIAAHGRWSEKSHVVYGYVRAESLWRDNPLAGIGL